jgi:hypothetical protein
MTTDEATLERENHEREALRAMREIVTYLNMNDDTRKMFLDVILYCEGWENDDDAKEYASDMLERAAGSLKGIDKAHNAFLQVIKDSARA